MVSQSTLVSVRMNERTQPAAINHQPRDKSTKLLRGQKINLEHADDVRAEGSIEESIDSKLGN